MRRIIFLICFVVLLSTVLFICCGGSNIELKENVWGEKENTSKKILIVYGSKLGSTLEVADSIGETLSKHKFMVDVKPADKAQSLENYKAVIIGSAIRAGKILSEIKDFVKNNKAILKNIPVAYFIVCMTMKDDTPENRKIADGYLDPLREEITPVDVGLFAGKMDYSKLGFANKIIVQHLVKTPEGDFRNWKQINSWADSLAFKIGLPGSSK
jgi:menaquinone-dependent protoporphyrinogen oxidase